MGTEARGGEGDWMAKIDATNEMDISKSRGFVSVVLTSGGGSILHARVGVSVGCSEVRCVGEWYIHKVRVRQGVSVRGHATTTREQRARATRPAGACGGTVRSSELLDSACATGL